MGGMIDGIYESLRFKRMGEGWKEGEAAEKRLENLLCSASFQNPEDLRMELAKLVDVSEREGFNIGFRYAVNLMAECWPGKMDEHKEEAEI